MTKNWTFTIVSIGLLGVAATLLLHISSLLPSDAATRRQNQDFARMRLAASYAQLPLSFEANQGQTGPHVQFLSRGSGYTLFLTATEAVLSLRRDRVEESAASEPSARRQDAVLRLKLLGANPSPKVTGTDELPGKSNYILGNDPAKWRANVPTYSKVTYADVYPGVDLIYYGDHDGHLEHDFIVAAHVDPGLIRFAIEGARNLSLSQTGDLLIKTAAKEIRLRKPFVYQKKLGMRKEISGEYSLEARNEVGFKLDSYDVNEPLIIDPVLVYSTYVGGSSERINDIAVDAAGNAYIVGQTDSVTFPTVNPLQPHYGGGSSFSSGDGFVVKLNGAGSSLIYSTYLGGSFGDSVTRISVDSSGSIYLAGETDSLDFPSTRMPLGPDSPTGSPFVAKLSSSGDSFIYSVSLGVGATAIYGMAVDEAGNAYFTGNTNSTHFPSTPGAFQSFPFSGLFVMKLNAVGSSLVYSTRVGTGLFPASAGAGGIAIDLGGNAYVVGTTTSRDFPTTPGAFQTSGNLDLGLGGTDAIVFKLNASGSALLYSTYLGGSDIDRGLAISVDSIGNAHIGGFTYSNNFPLVAAFQNTRGGGSEPDAFIVKLNSTGAALVYSTYLGGSAGDYATSVGLDSFGNLFVSGITGSLDFPFLNPLAASGGLFITKLNSGGLPIYSSGLGGSLIGYIADYGAGSLLATRMAIDHSGNVYVTAIHQPGAVLTTMGSFQGTPVAPFVMKIADTNPSPIIASLSPPSFSGGVPSNLNLAINGSNFVPGTVPQSPVILPGSTVRWSGSDRPTTFVNSGQLTASIPASDLTTSGPAQVTVLNPPPGGGTSNALIFTVAGPTINPGGTVNGASFAAGAAVSPGSISSVFGSSFTLLQGAVTVRMNGTAAPVFAVSDTQINFQVPWEMAGLGQANLTVSVGGVTSGPVAVPLTTFAPGIFSTSSSGGGQGAILIANTASIAAPAGMFPGSQPVSRGGFISIFCTGLGPVSNPPPTGVAASANPASLTTTTPTATIGGIPMEADFSGLAPGFFGLYQVNAQVPLDAPTGDAEPVVLSSGGRQSNTVTIAVQ